MPLRHEQRAAMLDATKGVASAFLEDISHIRDLLAERKTSRTQARYLSITLRRLLVNRELSNIASPRTGRLHFLVPDNKPFYKLEKRAPYDFFVSGGAPLFGPKFRPIFGRPGTDNSIARELPLLSNDTAEAIASVRIDGFLSQKVICLKGDWVTRQQVIKFVANVASGAHSATPHSPDEQLLAKIRNAISATSNGEEVTVTIRQVPDYNYGSDFNYLPDSIDMVLHELMSAAYYLNESPDVKALEASIRSELNE
ncbi:MAG: hypothetical protein SGJ07_05350 [Rhodospirillaceae bacterium]|nr:hypothetical protein [Rhodospirillaceae bacterium]